MVTYRHACQGIRWKPVHGSQLFLPGRVRESRRCPCHSDNACKYLATCLQMLLAKVSENSGDLPVLVLSVIKLPEWLNRKSPVCCWRSEQTLTPPVCTKRVAPGYAITPIWYWLWNNSLKIKWWNKCKSNNNLEKARACALYLRTVCMMWNTSSSRHPKLNFHIILKIFLELSINLLSTCNTANPPK